MNCRKVQNLISAYMDGELPGVEHRHIHDHLGLCQECAQEYQSLLQTKRLLSALRFKEPTLELPVKILQQVAVERSAQTPLGWWRQFFQQRIVFTMSQEVTPSWRSMVVGVGVAAVGMFFVSRTMDAADPTQAQGTMQWTPIAQAGMFGTGESAPPSAPRREVTFTPPSGYHLPPVETLQPVALEDSPPLNVPPRYFIVRVRPKITPGP